MTELDPQAGQTEPAAPQEGEEVLDQELPEGEQLPRTVAERARREAAKYRTERNELKTFVESLGGKDYVERVIGATRTTEGVAQLFMEAGRSFGIDNAVLQQLLSGESVVPGTKGAPAAALPDVDDDEPLSRKELRELEARLKEEIAKPLSDQRVADLAAQGARTIHQTLESLGATSDADKKRVMRYVAEFMPAAGSPDEFDPGVLSDAVRRGHQAFESDMESYNTNYLAKKRAAAGSPAGLGNGGGQAPTFNLPAEPRNSEEASKALEQWALKQQRG